MDLNPIERRILANQLEIMKQLEELRAALTSDTPATGHLEIQIKALEFGYPTEYEEIVAMGEGVDREVCDEVYDVLEMYRAFWIFGEKLDGPEGKWMSFQGFDGNNDPHYGYACYLMEDLEKYAESASCPMNSHSESTLPKYRSMLEVWKSIPQDERYELNTEQIRAILSA